MAQIPESRIDRRVAARPEERLLDIILWLVIPMGVWLPLVTLALMLAKGMGVVSLGWGFMFLLSLASLVLGILLLIGGYGVVALCQWVSPTRRDPSTKEFTSPAIPPDSSSERKQVGHATQNDITEAMMEIQN